MRHREEAQKEGFPIPIPLLLFWEDKDSTKEESEV